MIDGTWWQESTGSCSKSGESWRGDHRSILVSEDVQGNLDSLTAWNATLEHVWHQGCGPAMEQLWSLSGP